MESICSRSCCINRMCKFMEVILMGFMKLMRFRARSSCSMMISRVARWSQESQRLLEPVSMVERDCISGRLAKKMKKMSTYLFHFILLQSFFYLSKPISVKHRATKRQVLKLLYILGNWLMNLGQPCLSFLYSAFQITILK